jgi:hypothetical protein
MPAVTAIVTARHRQAACEDETSHLVMIHEFLGMKLDENLLVLGDL